MMPRSENRELPVIYLLLLAAVMVFLFDLSTGSDQQQDYTASSALCQTQGLAPVVPGISNQHVPTAFSSTEVSLINQRQYRCEQNLQRITRVMWLQARTDSFQRPLHPLRQFYLHYFSEGKVDFPSFC
jgi:hypothetical protein